MLNDNTQVKAKGRVLLEMYNEKGEVTFTKEKKNLVVLGANEIIGHVMSDPAKKTVASQIDKGDTLLAPNAGGTYEFALKHASESAGTYTTDVGSANTSLEVSIPSVKQLLSVSAVRVDGVDLVLNRDVSIKDPDTATLKFEVAPKNVITISFRQVASAYVEIVAGSEVVKVNNTVYKLANLPSDADKSYSINHKLGKVYFESAKANVEVSYKFKLFYSLGFMGLGAKPASHPSGKPVAFSDSDKLKVNMDAEFAAARQLIQYPAVIGNGEPEVEVFPTKSISYKEKTVVVTGDGVKTSFDLGATNKVLFITSAKLDADGAIVEATLEGTKVKFATAPEADTKVNVVFKEQLDNNHLIFEMADAPVLELIAVRHQALDNTVKQYNIVGKGLTIGQGDVWIMNPSKGILQFSADPKGTDPLDASKKPPVAEAPGQLTFEYRVNSGTTVQYVADFPKGVPGPMITEQVGEVLNVTSAVTTYTLSKTAVKDDKGEFSIVVTLNGVIQTKGTAYDVSADGKQIIFKVALQDTDSASVTYKYSLAAHEVYQVAMFTEQEDGKMFNISGIGPVTKDENTGMRITWSVTY